MKLLFTGRGTSGSFQIRGQQLGHALGALVRPMASLAECEAADVIVVVKRIPDDLLETIRKSGRPWVYDIVDSFPQPECSSWDKGRSLAWLRTTIGRLRPNAVIWPNAQMKEDFGAGGEVIYHHHRPGIAVNPIRERIQVVGYEGSEKFLQGWERAIAGQCKRLGARFIANPDRLAGVDVVLALRGAGWNGYPQQNWKSQIKLANAHGSGTPFIGMPEAAYQETRSGAEYWATDEAGLATALNWLESQSAREEVSARFLQAAIPIERVAEQYRAFLCKLKS